jgi:cysteinyl-tRNA synthetase
LREAEGDEADAEWMTKLNGYRADFEGAMDDDFNTARAIATLFDLSRDVNILLSSDEPASRATLESIGTLYRTLGEEVLGLVLLDKTIGLVPQADGDLVDGLVRMLIDVRQEARQGRDWARADAIRDQLQEMNIILEDGPDGTRWKLQR